MDETFDLIPASKKCNTFKVVFDTFTPRAHFIISPRKEAKKRNPDLDQNTTQKVVISASSIVESALSMVSAYDLKESAILSIHFGSWLTKKDELHAHICVDVEKYLTIFKGNKQRIPRWPSPEYVTKQWKASNDHNDYETNVRGYPFRIYHPNEVKDIKVYRKEFSFPTDNSDSSCPSLPPNFRLHQSEPRFLYVDGSRSRESKLAALKAMINFAERNNLTNINSEDDNDGCHVCLLLDERSNGKSIIVNLP